MRWNATFEDPKCIAYARILEPAGAKPRTNETVQVQVGYALLLDLGLAPNQYLGLRGKVQLSSYVCQFGAHPLSPGTFTRDCPEC